VSFSSISFIAVWLVPRFLSLLPEEYEVLQEKPTEGCRLCKDLPFEPIQQALATTDSCMSADFKAGNYLLLSL